MTLTRGERGFTLIELMIVVAIIAILAAIALPAYSKYRVKSAESACQMEMKNYASFSLVALYGEGVPGLPPQQACITADTAVNMETPIVGVPQKPGVRRTTCDMKTANCNMTP